MTNPDPPELPDDEALPPDSDAALRDVVEQEEDEDIAEGEGRDRRP